MSKFEKGQTVYVIERDDIGRAVEYLGFMYLGEVCGYALVSRFVYNEDGYVHEELESTLDHFFSLQREIGDPYIFLFPIKDCYGTYEEVEEMIIKEKLIKNLDIDKEILYKKSLYNEIVEKEKYIDKLLNDSESGSIESDIFLGALTAILWVKQLMKDTHTEDDNL